MNGRRLFRGAVRILAAVFVSIAAIVAMLVLVYTQPAVQKIPTTVPTAGDPDRLRAHVTYLATTTFPRDSDHPAVLRQAADYIEKALFTAGGRVTLQDFEVQGSTYRNVIATFGPETGPVFVFGAHYDSFDELPAADDNASGVAGMLELGRLLGAAPPRVRVQLVAYCLEEPPFFGSTVMGSAFHARALRESREPVLGMASLEMIAYYAPEQHWNNLLLQVLYPNRGDFLMVVGRWQDRRLVRYMKQSMLGASAMRVRSVVTLGLPPMDLSDHRNYWSSGYLAVLVTDTAFIRNPNYHTDKDLPVTLDYGKMAQVVEAMYGVAMHLDTYMVGPGD